MYRFRYAIVYHHKCITNIPHFTQHLWTHNHEETDTLIILHDLDVWSINPFAELIINSPETDVFLLLIYYQTKLCNRTLFRTGRGKDARSLDVKDAYESIGSKRAKALLGYRAFGDSDFTCKFNRKSKLTTWRHFNSSSDAVLDAFSQLGSPDLSVIDETTAKLQTYVMNLYCQKKTQHHQNYQRTALVYVYKTPARVRATSTIRICF